MSKTTRDKLLDAARAEFLENGWETTSGRRIEARATVSRGSWTHAYPGGKAEIAADIHAALYPQIWAGCLQVYCRLFAGPAYRPIRRSLEKLFDAVNEDVPAARLLFELDEALLRTPQAQRVKTHHETDQQVLRGWFEARGATKVAANVGSCLRAMLFAPALTLLKHAADCKVDDTSLHCLARAAEAGVNALLAAGADQGRRPRASAAPDGQSVDFR